LFLLIVEGLSRILKKLMKEDKIKGILVVKEIRITHLIFVDDIILFGRGNLIEWGVFNDALDLFSYAPGMDYSVQNSVWKQVGLLRS
jgi:hypothetical protein